MARKKKKVAKAVGKMNTGEFVRTKSGRLELMCDGDEDELTFDGLSLEEVGLEEGTVTHTDEMAVEDYLRRLHTENKVYKIVVDANPISASCDFAYKLYDIREYEHFDLDDLKHERLNLLRAKGLAASSMITIAEPQLKEFGRFVEILTGKEEWLEENYRYRQSRRGRRCLERVSAQKRDTFLELVRLSKETYDTLSGKVFVPENRQAYEELVEATVYVSERTHSRLKAVSDDSFRPQYARGTRKPIPRADEKLVAAALYNALANQERSTLLTGDSDIKKIVRCTYGVIARMNSPFGSQAFHSLREVPVKLCIVDKETAEWRFMFATDGAIPHVLCEGGQEVSEEVCTELKDFVEGRLEAFYGALGR